MKACVLTPFRDAAAYLGKYMDMAARLDWPAGNLRFVFVEGDSVDDTRELLIDWYLADPRRVTVLRYDTHRPRYGSIVSAERFRALSEVFNCGLEHILRVGWADIVQFIPGDVEFGPELIQGLARWNADVIAPLFWLNRRGQTFYDTWGFSKWGTVYYPRGETPEEMDTVGGAIQIKIETLRAGVRYTPEDVDRGLCMEARKRGFRVWADPTTHIVHPANLHRM